MSFEKDSIFSEQLDSKKASPSKTKRGPKKDEPEGLDDLFGGGSSKKDGGGRVPVKTW